MYFTYSKNGFTRHDTLTEATSEASRLLETGHTGVYAGKVTHVGILGGLVAPPCTSRSQVIWQCIRADAEAHPGAMYGVLRSTLLYHPGDCIHVRGAHLRACELTEPLLKGWQEGATYEVGRTYLYRATDEGATIVTSI